MNLLFIDSFLPMLLDLLIWVLKASLIAFFIWIIVVSLLKAEDSAGVVIGSFSRRDLLKYFIFAEGILFVVILFLLILYSL